MGAFACAAPAPLSTRATPVGLVRADDEATADRYAALLEHLHPRVQQILPDALERPTELWVQDVLRRDRHEEHRSDAMGFTILGRNLEPGRIHLRANASYPTWYLAHELVHGLMGPSWAPLPGVLTEGLCDALAARVSPEVNSVIRTHRALHAGLYFGDMRYRIGYTHPASGEERRADVTYAYANDPAEHDPEDLLTRSRRSFHSLNAVPATYYGLGFVFVERVLNRIGIDGLHELCLEATRAGHAVVPERWLLDAAGFESIADWPLAIADVMGRDETERIAGTMPALFSDLTLRVFAQRFGHLSLDAFLTSANPRLHLRDGTVVPVSELDPVCFELEAAWPGSDAVVSAAAF